MSCPATLLFEIETSPNRGAAFRRRFGNLPQLLSLALTTSALGRMRSGTGHEQQVGASAGGRLRVIATTRNRHVSNFAANTGTSRDTAVPGDAKVGVASFYTRSSHGERRKTQSGRTDAAIPSAVRHACARYKCRYRRSVVVRVNDRGPFVKGRTLDVSYSAAKQLEMTERGIAKVKMEVLQ